jgi:pyruvate/2-oxoglutarate/acetoin dehydrogenase E1 component
MAREMMYGEAMATAIIEEMQRDADVVFYGQNMAMTERDPMLKMFGEAGFASHRSPKPPRSASRLARRLRDHVPSSNSGMSEFMLVAMDQLLNEAPRLRYMSGGQVKVPLVLKAGYGFAAGWGG